MNILNLTGHPINVFKGSHLIKTIQSSGIIRLPFNAYITEHIDQIPVFHTEYQKCELPQEDPDTIIIVSKIVCEVHTKRKDLFIIVNTRSDKGRVVGCDGICRNPFYKTKTKLTGTN